MFFFLHLKDCPCAGFAFIWDLDLCVMNYFPSEIIFEDKTGTQFKK